MHELVIEVGATGRVAAMHTDKFDLGFLGDKKIRRQTEIVFCEESQLWDIVYIADDGMHHGHACLDGFGGYEEAREFEVRWINACRLHQILSNIKLAIPYAAFLRFGPQSEDKCFTLPDGDCIADHCMHTGEP